MVTQPLHAPPVRLRIAASGRNWIRIASQLALGLAGYRGRLPYGSAVEIICTEPGTACSDAPLIVADGRCDIAITSPDWFGVMAQRGIGLFDAPLPVRALAVLPHDDRLVIAVREETGITSIDELIAVGDLRISAPAPATRHPGVVVADQVLGEYGTSLDDLCRRGATLLDDRPVDIADDPEPVDPSFSVIMDEAIMTQRWRRIFDRYRMRPLPIADEVLSSMEARGYRRGTIEPGRLPGVSEPIPTLDFSGWLLLCRDDLDDGLADAILRTLFAERDTIEAMIGPDTGRSGPIEPTAAVPCADLVMHPAAEAFYAEQGALARGRA